MSTLTKNPYTFWKNVKNSSTEEKVTTGLILFILLALSVLIWYAWWYAVLPLGESWETPLKIQVGLIGLAGIIPPLVVGKSSKPKRGPSVQKRAKQEKDRGDWIEEMKPSPGIGSFLKALFSSGQYKLQWAPLGLRYIVGLLVIGLVIVLFWTTYLTEQTMLDQLAFERGNLYAATALVLAHAIGILFLGFCITLPVRDESHWEADADVYDDMPNGMNRYSASDRQAWIETLERKRQDEETTRKLFRRENQVETTKPAPTTDETFFSWLVRQSKGLETKLGGPENYQAVVMTFMVIVLAFIFVNVLGPFIAFAPGIAIAFFVARGWGKRKKPVNVTLAIAGAILSVILAATIYGTQAALKEMNPLTLMASASGERNGLLNFFGLFDSDEDAVVPTAIAPVVPVEVVMFDPEHTLQNFDPKFTAGAIAELTQVVGYLNGSISLVKEVEANRAAAPTEQGKVNALNTTLLLAGIPGETGIAESQSVVASWCTTGVQRADGTFEATTYEERVLAEQEALIAEGANVGALVTTSYKLCEAYAEFVEMLQSLEMDKEKNVRNEQDARQHLQRFLELRAELNGTLTQLFGVETTLEEFDPNFVNGFMAIANSKGSTIVATATPYNPGPSAPVVPIMQPTPTLAPTETPVPTDVPPPTSPPAPVGCTRQGAGGVTSHGIDANNAIRPYADPGYLPFNVSFTLTPVDAICGHNWASLENGQVWAVANTMGLQAGQTYWKYAIGQGSNVTEWGFQSPNGAKIVIYQMPATAMPLPTAPAFSGCTELLTSNNPTVEEIRARLHSGGVTIVNGEIVIVPYVTLFDMAFAWPAEGTPFSIQAVSNDCGKNWVYVGSEIWAYDNVLGLSPGVTYYRQLIKENGATVGVRYVDGAGNVGYEWRQ